jgi:hypothetical protein
MSLNPVLRSVYTTANHHGSLPAMYDVGVRILNKCMYYRVMQCLVFDEVPQRAPTLAETLHFTKLEKRDLLRFSQSASSELTPEFVHHALAKGDECYAILDGTNLASYGWYSRQPTRTNCEDLTLHFDWVNYVYMYKAFTVERYRGQRLHAIGVTQSLMRFRSLGYKGLLCYVESNNFDSLKSSYRMGYRSCGRIHVLRVAGQYIIRPQSECRDFGLTVAVDRKGVVGVADKAASG